MRRFTNNTHLLVVPHRRQPPPLLLLGQGLPLSERHLKLHPLRAELPRDVLELLLLLGHDRAVGHLLRVELGLVRTLRALELLAQTADGLLEVVARLLQRRYLRSVLYALDTIVRPRQRLEGRVSRLGNEPR